MRVLFDFNNLACRCACRERIEPNGQPDWAKVAFAMFAEIHEFLLGMHEFLDEGENIETVLAHDYPHGYWRGDIYPKYKGNREKTRQQSAMDWDRAREEFGRIADLMAHATPWLVLCVEKCEADDVIFTLANENEEPVVIYSGDCDYLQLVDDHISLYVPHQGDFAEFPRVCRVGAGEVFCETPEVYLQYAILTGQGGKDNVYNVKTPTDWDETKRKPGFGVAAAKRILGSGECVKEELAKMGLLDNYLRNRELIDMRCLPDAYRADIMRSWRQANRHAPDMASFVRYYNWQPSGFDADQTNNELALVAGCPSGIRQIESDDISAASDFEI